MGEEFPRRFSADLETQFENIQKLVGHHSEIWALAVSHHGKFVVTGSHDKSIRVWEKLDEPVRLLCIMSSIVA